MLNRGAHRRSERPVARVVRTRAGLAIGVAALAAVVVSVVILTRPAPPGEDGPLSGDRPVASSAVVPGAGTVAMLSVLLVNRGGAPRITKVRVAGGTASVVGAGFRRLGDGPLPLAGAGYPPAGVRLLGLGARIPVSRSVPSGIGGREYRPAIRLVVGIAFGRAVQIDALVVEYHVGSRRYRARVGTTTTLCRVPASAGGQTC